MNKTLTIEQIAKMSQEEIIEAYRNGYRLEKLSPETATEMLANLSLAVIGVTVGSVIYYNLGKLLTKKLGWEK